MRRCELVQRRLGIVLLSLVSGLGGSACTWVSAAEHAERVRLLDMDGDGHDAIEFGGTDCDDDDAAVNPGATETCLREGDEDCNGLADGDDPDAEGLEFLYPDADGDGFGDKSGKAVRGCLNIEPGVIDNSDCDDDNEKVNPQQLETCETEYDDDCDGLFNANDPDVIDGITVYPDVDGDGFGDKEKPGTLMCDVGPGQSDVWGGCNDGADNVFPGAPMECPGDYSQFKDCDGPPPQCELESFWGRSLYFGTPVDDLAAGGSYLVARSEHLVAVWRDVDPKIPLSWPSGTARIELSAGHKQARLAAGELGALIGDPTADAGDGRFYCVTDVSGEVADVQVFMPDKRNHTVGSAVAWLPDDASSLPGVVYGTGGGRTQVSWVESGSPSFVLGASLPNDAAALHASVSVLDEVIVAAGSPLDSGGAGKVWLARGASVDALAETWSGQGAAEDRIGAEVLTMLVNDNVSPDLVATTTDGVRIWIDPLDGGTEVRDISVAAEPSAIASGDFDGDGRADLAVGVSLDDIGAGRVLVFLAPRIEQGRERVAIVGAKGEQLGSGLAFARVDEDDIDDLIVGSGDTKGPATIMFVPGSTDWSLDGE